MRNWLVGIVGENLASGAMLVVITFAIVLAFMLLFMIYRGFSPGLKTTGKRARQARLAVMDAAIVDSKRRLVLVRRDDVEHLLMIGGPIDVVIEQNIRRQRPMIPQNTAPQRGREMPPTTSRQPQAVKVAARPDRTAGGPTGGTAGTAPPQRSSTGAPTPADKPQPTQKVADAPGQPMPVAQKTTAAPTTTAPAKPLPPVTENPVAPATASKSAAIDKKPNVDVSVKTTSAPSQSSSAPEVKTGGVLKEFEEKLAMNRGEKIVPQETGGQDSLASEMDELLSEITAGSKTRK